jgi:hypothetical protein
MGSADRLGVAPNLPSTFANGGRYGSQFEGFGSEPTPDSSEVGDVDRTGCEGLHDGHLLPRRSEDPKPWKAEFAGASDPVKRLGSSQPSNRWSTEGRDRGSPQLATRNIPAKCPELLDAVDIIGRLMDSDLRGQGSAMELTPSLGRPEAEVPLAR